MRTHIYRPRAPIERARAPFSARVQVPVIEIRSAIAIVPDPDRSRYRYRVEEFGTADAIAKSTSAQGHGGLRSVSTNAQDTVRMRKKKTQNRTILR